MFLVSEMFLAYENSLQSLAAFSLFLFFNLFICSHLHDLQKRNKSQADSSIRGGMAENLLHYLISNSSISLIRGLLGLLRASPQRHAIQWVTLDSSFFPQMVFQKPPNKFVQYIWNKTNKEKYILALPNSLHWLLWALAVSHGPRPRVLLLSLFSFCLWPCSGLSTWGK